MHKKVTIFCISKKNAVKSVKNPIGRLKIDGRIILKWILDVGYTHLA
jgi:hypothetical protein